MRSLAEKVAAAAVMISCCGLAMALALGLVVLSSGWLVASVAGLAGAGCLAVAIFAVGRRSRSADHCTPTAEIGKART